MRLPRNGSFLRISRRFPAEHQRFSRIGKLTENGAIPVWNNRAGDPGTDFSTRVLLNQAIVPACELGGRLVVRAGGVVVET